MIFERFRDCEGKSVLGSLQAFHLRVDSVEKRIAVIVLHCRWLQRNCFKRLCYSPEEDVHGYLDLDLEFWT